MNKMIRRHESPCHSARVPTAFHLVSLAERGLLSCWKTSGGYTRLSLRRRARVPRPLITPTQAKARFEATVINSATASLLNTLLDPSLARPPFIKANTWQRADVKLSGRGLNEQWASGFCFTSVISHPNLKWKFTLKWLWKLLTYQKKVLSFYFTKWGMLWNER